MYARAYVGNKIVTEGEMMAQIVRVDKNNSEDSNTPVISEPQAL
jgi:hypothetical protein